MGTVTVVHQSAQISQRGELIDGPAHRQKSIFQILSCTHLQISCFPISDVLQSYRSTAAHLLLSLRISPILHSHSYFSVHLRLSRTHLSHLLLSLPHTNKQDGSQVICHLRITLTGSDLEDGKTIAEVVKEDREQFEEQIFDEAETLESSVQTPSSAVY